MSRLQKILAQWLKKIFSDLHAIILGAIFLALIASAGGVYLFARNLWIALTGYMQLPTPLWVTIALVLLLGVCIYLKRTKSHSLSNSAIQKIKYFTIGKLKWKVIIHHKNHHEVNELPLCLKHDLRLLYENYRYFCPEVMKNNCNISFPAKEHYKVYENAKSYIDKELRNKKC